MEAITNLKEPAGSNKTTIGTYIEEQYWAPPNFKRLMSAKLKFLTNTGRLIKGHVLAKELVARGLQTTVITDYAMFAMISRVNMVIVGAHAVMENGSVIAPVGLNMVALAAQRHVVPFVVLAGIHKLSDIIYQRPDEKSGGHGVGCSPIIPYLFSVPQEWEEVPVSITDLGGTEIDLRFGNPKEGHLFVIVAPVLRFADIRFSMVEGFPKCFLDGTFC